MPSWSCDRVRIGPNKFPPEIAIDAPTANIAASRCRGCFSGHYEHIGGAWDHHRPRVVPFPKRVKKTWPSTAYSFAPPDPFVPIQVPTPTYLGPARGWSRWRGVPGRYYGNPFCLSGSTSLKARARAAGFAPVGCTPSTRASPGRGPVATGRTWLIEHSRYARPGNPPTSPAGGSRCTRRRPPRRGSCPPPRPGSRWRTPPRRP